MEKLFPIITFCDGLPTEAVIHDLTDTKSHNMVVVDDLMNELLSTEKWRNFSRRVLIIKNLASYI